MIVMTSEVLETVVQYLKRQGPMAYAVSGGIDSLTLAVIASRYTDGAKMYHAISPAVPKAATRRVQALKETETWDLRIFDAKEFKDSKYLQNPHDRCFYCKSNLYQNIRRLTDLPIASGTNKDDLTDYRPGLKAAENNKVLHPFAELGVDKPTIRELADYLGMKDYAQLPASPCLSSRIETGIPIEAKVLSVIESIETMLRQEIDPTTVRCRMRSRGVVIELDQDALLGLDMQSQANYRDRIQAFLLSNEIQSDIEFAPYVMGSTFLRA